MAQRSSVFRETYELYMEKIQGIDLAAAAGPLGGNPVAGGVGLPFFGRVYSVTPEGITDRAGARAPFDVCIVLFKYLVMCPDPLPGPGEWTAFRDFKDAAPLVHYFAANAENAVVKTFSGKLDTLARAAKRLGGQAPAEPLAYDLAMEFCALPKIPLLLLFNDAEEGFEARCSILFRKSTEAYLDMECAGILGAQLAGYLAEAATG